MKLPRALAGLAGPSTVDSQKTFLRDLKQAFRDRIEQRAPPLKSSIDRHLQSVIEGHKQRDSVKDTSTVAQTNPGLAARQLYIEGKLTHAHLHDLLSRSTCMQDLDTVKAYSLKAGIDFVSRPTDLSARYCAKLLYLGHIEEVKRMIERNTTQWILTRSAHPLLVQYASRSSGGIHRARQVFDNLLAHDSKNLTTPLVRCMLRESVRANDLDLAVHCLTLSTTAAKGQETGLANWLSQRGKHEVAFAVLRLAEPSTVKEGTVGLEITRRLVTDKKYDRAMDVLNWVESRYILSLQKPLRELEEEIAAKASWGTSQEESRSVSPVASDVHGAIAQM